MSLQLISHNVFAKDLTSALSYTSGSSKVPVTPVPENQTPSASLWKYLHITCIHGHGYIHKTPEFITLCF